MKTCLWDGCVCYTRNFMIFVFHALKVGRMHFYGFNDIMKDWKQRIKYFKNRFLDGTFPRGPCIVALCIFSSHVKLHFCNVHPSQSEVFKFSPFWRGLGFLTFHHSAAVFIDQECPFNGHLVGERVHPFWFDYMRERVTSKLTSQPFVLMRVSVQSLSPVNV